MTGDLVAPLQEGAPGPFVVLGDPVLVNAGSFDIRSAFGDVQCVRPLRCCEVEAQFGTGIALHASPCLGSALQRRAEGVPTGGGRLASVTGWSARLVRLARLIGVGEGLPCLVRCLSTASPDPGEKPLHIAFLAGRGAVVGLRRRVRFGGRSPRG